MRRQSQRALKRSQKPKWRRACKFSQIPKSNLVRQVCIQVDASTPNGHRLICSCWGGNARFRMQAEETGYDSQNTRLAVEGGTAILRQMMEFDQRADQELVFECRTAKGYCRQRPFDLLCSISDCAWMKMNCSATPPNRCRWCAIVYLIFVN